MEVAQHKSNMQSQSIMVSTYSLMSSYNVNQNTDEPLCDQVKKSLWVPWRLNGISFP